MSTNTIRAALSTVFDTSYRSAVRTAAPTVAVCATLIACATATHASTARADDTAPARAATLADDTAPARAATPASERAAPDAGTFPFQPYSFLHGAISTTAIAHADSLCPASSTVCPFGGGGGIFIAGGWRYARAREWLVGYDLSVRNARSLFSSATVQQIRIDHRWIVGATVHNFEAFLGAGGGVAVFGELLGVRTFGATLGVSAGGTYNLSAFARIGALIRLDATRFLIPFTAGDGVLRADGGVAAITATFMLTASFLGR